MTALVNRPDGSRRGSIGSSAGSSVWGSRHRTSIYPRCAAARLGGSTRRRSTSLLRNGGGRACERAAVKGLVLELQTVWLETRDRLESGGEGLGTREDIPSLRV